MNQNRRRNAFTLIELLTVIAIIAILIALLFPAIKSSLQKAEIAQAQNDVKNIEGALKAYYTEYGKWPNGNGIATDYSYGSPPPLYPNYCGNYGLMDTLRSIQDSDPGGCGNGMFVNNPRKIQFIEIPTKSLDQYGNFLDPWKHPYQITLDTGFDNICQNLAAGGPSPVGLPPNAVTNRNVVVWSFGPDGIAGTKDDITSW